MVAHGLLEDERVELLEGQLVTMSPHGPDHAELVTRLAERLMTATEGRARVRIQCGFATSDSVPEPDLSVVAKESYGKAHPTEALLIVEVARTSLKKDRGIKARIYAAAGVWEYWIVNLAERRVEVSTSPTDSGYRRVQVYGVGDQLRSDAIDGLSVDVSALFDL